MINGCVNQRSWVILLSMRVMTELFGGSVIRKYHVTSVREQIYISRDQSARAVVMSRGQYARACVRHNPFTDYM